MLIQNTKIDLSKYYRIYNRNNGNVFTPNIDHILFEICERNNIQKERINFWSRIKSCNVSSTRVASKGQINVELPANSYVSDQFDIYNSLRIIYINPLVAVNCFVHIPTYSCMPSDYFREFRCCVTQLITQQEIDIISDCDWWDSSTKTPPNYIQRYELVDIFKFGDEPKIPDPSEGLRFDIVGLLSDTTDIKWLYNGRYMFE